MLQLIAEAGGISSILTFLFKWWARSQLAGQANNRGWKKQLGPKSETVLELSDDLLDWVFGLMAVCSFVILLSTIVLPFIEDDVRVVFLIASERSFFFFSWENLKEYAYGPEDAKRLIVLLPFQVAYCTNFTAVFATNRMLRIKK